MNGPRSGDDSGAPPHLPHPDVVFCPGGPMLLRGNHLVRDADGNEHRTTRPVTAVCQCGASALAPWCDGTHKTLGDRNVGGPNPRPRH